MMTIQEIYTTQVKALPVLDRLQLARLIMDELADSAPHWVAHLSHIESRQDLAQPQAQKRPRKPKLDWRGALQDVQEQYTSVQLQHKALEWREG